MNKHTNKNMLWKSLFLTKGDRKASNNTTETKFVLKSKKCPTQTKKIKSSSTKSTISYRINLKNISNIYQKFSSS